MIAKGQKIFMKSLAVTVSQNNNCVLMSGMFSLKKSMLVLMGCILILMSVTCAFASESNQICYLEDVEICELNLNDETDISKGSEFQGDMLEIEEHDSCNVTENFAETEGTSDVIPASYDDLCHDIENLKPDSTYDIKKDYIIEGCGEDLSKNRIMRISADNVVIDGHGHTINANGNRGYFAVFNVTGKNVTIMNLNIINTRIYNHDYSISSWNRYGDDYTRVLSPIQWYGDNGLLLNCVFDDNVGEKGGAVYWAGNAGLIDNCYFNNNAATICGGSIYKCGYNNIIRNSLIKDSDSCYNDAIFIKNFDENGKLLELFINNCTFENSMSFINDFHVEGTCVIIKDNKQIFPVIPAGSYNELREIIRNLKDGDVCTLTNDYYFDYDCYYYPIKANNVIINGNGHKIYGTDALVNSLIWVTGNNVTVTNLIFDFKNLREDLYGASFVNWKGNNGVLENCSFVGNRAQYGGAVIWQGNEGIIKNCAFINNTAYISAGAIFISGENNRISNCLILNSNSELSGESIFIDYKRKNLTMENVYFNLKGIPLFDAGKIYCNINFNVEDVLDRNYYSRIGNEKILINELIYLSLLNGGTINLNDHISYYSRYFNESGDFILTVTKIYNQHGISYVQEYHFKDIINYTFSDIFTKLRSGDFETKIILTKTAYILDEFDYYIMLNEFYNMKSFSSISGDLNRDKDFIKTIVTPFTYVFNVVFNKTLTIDCDDTWVMKDSPYDMLVINGAGSTIRASFKDREKDKWVVLSEGKTFYAYNITLEGFNTVIENMGGECMLDQVCFRNNRMDYLIDRDWGAAILNVGVCICNKCSFENNYAKNGGAIFNQGYLVLDNCTFAGNRAYGEGNDVCNANGGTVLFDGADIKESTAYVTCVESISGGWQVLIEISAFVVSFVAGFVAGFVTANPVIGAAVGVLVGAGLGIGASATLIAYSYNAKMNRLALTVVMTVSCMIVGAVGGITGGAVSPYGAAQFEVDAGVIAEENPEIIEFIYMPEDGGLGFIGPVIDTESEFTASEFTESVIDISFLFE